MSFTTDVKINDIDNSILMMLLHKDILKELFPQRCSESRKNCLDKPEKNGDLWLQQVAIFILNSLRCGRRVIVSRRQHIIV